MGDLCTDGGSQICKHDGPVVYGVQCLCLLLLSFLHKILQEILKCFKSIQVYGR